MNKKPLLVFPSPTDASKSGLPSGRGDFYYPSKERQIERVEEKITELDRVLANKSASLQQEIGNVIPEMILVLETAGEIKDFFKAVKKTPGMEFLAEHEGEIEPDDDFYSKDKDGIRMDKPVETRFYLTMTNQEALKELKKYWDEYKKDKADQKYKKGVTNFRTLFEQLVDIRTYSVEDRVRDTGLKDYIVEKKKYDFEKVKFEIELAYKEDDKRNHLAYQEVIQLLKRQEGNEIKGSRTLIPQISYHAFIAEAPIQVFDDLTENTHILFLKSQQILFFRPVGQAVFTGPPKKVELPEIGFIEGEVIGDSTVALLDGLPLENHMLLRDRVQVDDPEEFAASYTGSKRFHGTAMASLILHGDLDDSTTIPLRRPLYVRPIMRLNSQFDDVESLPDDKLPIDLIHSAVKRMKSGENGLPATAPHVKIVNFSIGDAFRPFHNNLSSWARLLDWLSYEYDILFIISSGNQTENLVLDIPENDFDKLSEEEVQELVLRKIIETNYNRKILTPAESINAITVGASHNDYSKPGKLFQRKNLIKNPELLSPVSRIGFGYRKSVKPEILMPGGRKLYRKSPIQPDSTKTVLKIETTPFFGNPPGNKAALPGYEGQLNAAGYLCGTSNAAALTTRLGAQLYEILLSLGNQEGENVLKRKYFTVLIKCLLVHSASWESSSGILLEMIKKLSGTAKNTSKKNLLPFLGYGQVEPQKILYCTDQRVTLLGCGELSHEGAHLYRFPLPPSISSEKLYKKLTITLAYHSPLNHNTRKYRKAQLFFDNLRGNEYLELERPYYDFRTSRSGTVQHDILYGDKADVFVDGDVLTIKVNCREDASGLRRAAIKYGLAVTLELKEGIDVKIYEEIEQRIRPRIRPQV